MYVYNIIHMCVYNINIYLLNVCVYVWVYAFVYTCVCACVRAWVCGCTVRVRCVQVGMVVMKVDPEKPFSFEKPAKPSFPTGHTNSMINKNFKTRCL